MPLPVTESHSDHTWNIALNDYSAYTDIRLVVDIFKNPYQNDQGSIQEYGKIARLLIAPNVYGHCLFNVEQVIRNIVKANPRSMTMMEANQPGGALVDPYEVLVANSSTTAVVKGTSQATIANARTTTISYSNGFNGGYEGFENIYQINEYRCIFGVQYTSGTTTQILIDSENYGIYSGYTGPTISVYSASTQPYGVMIFPGIQDNKKMSQLYYYSSSNLNGQYNYLNTKVYDWQLTGQTGQFMATFGSGTIPMTLFGDPTIYQTRWRTHYYKCPIVLPFMYGGNPLYNNTASANTIVYLQKNTNNNQMNYDAALAMPIDYTARANAQDVAPYSYLSQRIAYGIFKQNPVLRTDSDVAIFISSDPCNIDYGSFGVSELVQYKMVGEECFNDPISFLFMNRQGVWDTYTFTKKSNKTYSVDRKTYSPYKSLNTTIWNRQSYDALEQTYYGTADELFVVDSNFVTQNDSVIIEELLMSPYVYIIEDNWLPASNQQFIYPYLIPCVVQNKDVKVFQQKYQRIFQYTIELKQVPYRKFELPI